jgi:hypothetical protein
MTVHERRTVRRWGGTVAAAGLICSCMFWGSAQGRGAGSSPGYVYNSDNDAAMALFHMGGSARGQAFGGAYASLARGAEAAYWNPGGLAYQATKAEIVVSPRMYGKEDYELGQDGRSYFMTQAAYRWKTWAVGASYLHYSLGDILYNDGTAAGGSSGSGWAPNDVSLDRTLSYSQSGFILAGGGTFLRDHLGVGLSVKRLVSSFDGALVDTYLQGSETKSRGTGLALQAGGIYRVNEDLAAGAVIDLPSKVDWGSDTQDEGALRLQTSGSYCFFRSPVLLATAALQLENIGGAWARAHAGMEVTTFNLLSVRAGFKNLHLKSGDFDTGDLNKASAFTVGVGTHDLRLMEDIPVGLDVSFDSQDFNTQVATSLKVGF